MKSFKKHFKLSLTALTMCAALTGCISSLTQEQVKVSTTQAFSQLNPKENYADLASRADEQSRFASLILKTRYYVVNRDLTAASTTVEELFKNAMTPLQQDQIMIMQALIASQSSHYAKAADLLEKVNTIALPNQVSVYYYQLLSNVYLSDYKNTKNTELAIKSFKARKDLLNFVEPGQKKTVLTSALSALKMLDGATLASTMSSVTDPIEKGYYEYALIDSSRTANLKNKLFASWKESYPQHPLNALLGGSVNVHSSDSSTDTATLPLNSTPALKNGDRVALLLPLTGRFAKNVGESAKLGVIAAIQDREAKINLDLYDTNVMSMQEIVDKLNKNNTAFIIGPVLKPEVEALSATNTKITTIALNEPAHGSANMFYFDLGPDYEAATAAAKIFSDGYSKPLLITNNSQRAERIIQGFAKTFTSTGKSVANTCRFNTLESAKGDLGTCSYNKADSVYINASSREANAIKAMLPAGMPVYLSSESYDGINNTGLEIALKGATIGQMPWLITDSALKAEVTKSLPKADTLALQIFASSYDALNVAFNLDKLTSSKDDLLHGLTGDIIVGEDNLLERSLMWYRIGSDTKGRY